LFSAAFKSLPALNFLYIITFYLFLVKWFLFFTKKPSFEAGLSYHIFKLGGKWGKWGKWENGCLVILYALRLTPANATAENRVAIPTVAASPVSASPVCGNAGA